METGKIDLSQRALSVREWFSEVGGEPMIAS